MWGKKGTFLETDISYLIKRPCKQRSIDYINKTAFSKITEICFSIDFSIESNKNFMIQVVCSNPKVVCEFQNAFLKEKLLPYNYFFTGTMRPCFYVSATDPELLKSFIKIIKKTDPSIDVVEKDINRKMSLDFKDYPLYPKPVLFKPVLFKGPGYSKSKKAYTYTWEDSKRLYRQKKSHDPKCASHTKPKNPRSSIRRLRP